MRMFRALLGLTVALTGTAAGLPVTASAASAATITAITADRGDHGHTPVPVSDVWTPDNAVVTATPSGGEALRLKAVRGEHFIEIDLAPPAGSTWTAGQVYQAARFADTDNARIDIHTPGSGCNTVNAAVTVLEVSRDPGNGRVNSFAAWYEFQCGADRGVLSGDLRWQSTVDYVAAVPEPGQLDLGHVEVGGAGTSRTVTFTSRGTLPAVFSTAGVLGPGAAQFALTADTCSARTVAPGESCAITVATRATLTGPHTATLVLYDNSGRGARLVPMSYGAAYGVTGMYYPLPPQRLMDTRSGLGGHQGKIGARQTVDLLVQGRGGVPAGAGSVVLNVTVTNPTAASFLNVFQTGEGRPNASSVNFPAGWLGSNNVTVKLGWEGKISVYNHSGSTDVVVDVVGFYAGDHLDLAAVGVGGNYAPLTPTRLFDSRRTGGIVPAGSAVRLWADLGPELSGHVRGLVLNVTAVKPQRAGFLSVWSGEGAVPTASTVNHGAGTVVPNLTIARTGFCADCGPGYAVPSFAVHTSQNAHIVIDVVGVMDDGQVPDGMRFRPLWPTRILDSRTAIVSTGPLGPNTSRSVSVHDREEVPRDTEALVTNVTAVSPTADTVITVWQMGLDKPTASNLNPAVGQTVSNAAFPGIGLPERFEVHNHAGSTHVVADVVGTFHRHPGTATGELPRGTSRYAVVGSGSRPLR
ncbi:choice-of-anchor D domain-containing protein [Micromonospora sp. KC213]|uniref:choice-of-anchor D domain-containing protein n=1 Tax=Micromonospora sp. KC213 TaxID=2530378 RepID=UPI0010522525|nr:choice-of-anchor D domain-containing protein [Micromonospora sp. KC213]TDC41046.1 choice-of-anchor D domain-containing protein [Micromonospora sp. KC213]